MSEPALALARQNAALNGLANLEYIKGDVFAQLEALTAAIEALSEKDIEGRRIVRSDFDESFFSPLPKEQLDTYREALLIFYGKVSVYLKSMGRARPPEWREWIG